MRRLMAAAEEVISEREVSSLTMGEVARRAGMAVGTLYTRFPDKDTFLTHLGVENAHRSRPEGGHEDMGRSRFYLCFRDSGPGELPASPGHPRSQRVGSSGHGAVSVPQPLGACASQYCTR